MDGFHGNPMHSVGFMLFKSKMEAQISFVPSTLFCLFHCVMRRKITKVYMKGKGLLEDQYPRTLALNIFTLTQTDGII